MFRFIIPTTLIVISVIGFLTFTNPIFQDVSSLRAQVASYDEALGNSKLLENARDDLTSKSSKITQDNLYRITKFLPDNVDNIRLILEIEKLATPYGMALRDVKYDTASQNATTAGASPTPAPISASPTSTTSSRDYGVWNLEFSISGSYTNFMSFLQDLERNLRIVDVSSIEFSSDVGAGLTPSTSPDIYKYSFKIKTYWLKN